MTSAAGRGAAPERSLGYSITLPQSWYELELRPALRDDAIRRLVEQRAHGVPELWEQRRAIQRLLTRHAEDAWASGARYAAGFALPTDDGPVTGSLTISLLDDPFATAAEPASPDDRFATRTRGDDPTEPWAHTSVVEVDGLTMVRSQGVEDAPLPGGGLVRHVFALDVVPVRPDGRLFLLAFSSPVLPLVDELHDLFAAVAETFRVVRLDDLPADAAGPSASEVPA